MSAPSLGGFLPFAFIRDRGGLHERHVSRWSGLMCDGAISPPARQSALTSPQQKAMPLIGYLTAAHPVFRAVLGSHKTCV